MFISSTGRGPCKGDSQVHWGEGDAETAAICGGKEKSIDSRAGNDTRPSGKKLTAWRPFSQVVQIYLIGLKYNTAVSCTYVMLKYIYTKLLL